MLESYKNGILTDDGSSHSFTDYEVNFEEVEDGSIDYMKVIANTGNIYKDYSIKLFHFILKEFNVFNSNPFLEEEIKYFQYCIENFGKNFYMAYEYETCFNRKGDTPYFSFFSYSIQYKKQKFNPSRFYFGSHSFSEEFVYHRDKVLKARNLLDKIDVPSKCKSYSWDMI